MRARAFEVFAGGLHFGPFSARHDFVSRLYDIGYAPRDAEGLTEEGENHEAGKTPETTYVVSYEEDFDIHPALSREQQGVMSGQERERAAGAWFGAETRGSRQAGYKITLLKTKALKSGTPDGVTEEWAQKLTLAAEIIPGGKATSPGLGGGYAPAAAARLSSLWIPRAALRRRRFCIS